MGDVSVAHYCYIVSTFFITILTLHPNIIMFDFRITIKLLISVRDVHELCEEL